MLRQSPRRKAECQQNEREPDDARDMAVRHFSPVWMRTVAEWRCLIDGLDLRDEMRGDVTEVNPAPLSVAGEA